MPIDNALKELTPNPIKLHPEPETSETLNINFTDKEFYSIKSNIIKQKLSPEYISFLKKAEYEDFDKASEIKIAKTMLKINPAVRQSAQDKSILIRGNDKDDLVQITQAEARKLAENLGYKLLTTGIMFNLFIPYLEEMIKYGVDQEAKSTMREMLNGSEWLADIVYDRTDAIELAIPNFGKKVAKEISIGPRKIGINDITLELPEDQGYFHRTDINVYGYPERSRYSQEFFYYPDEKNSSKTSVLRGFGNKVGIGFVETECKSQVIGMRLSKIIY